MTIGQKIMQLRNNADISQEQLAEMLGVSRQSISKWEMDQALPQIDKVLQLCELFNVSADELLGIDIVKQDEEINDWNYCSHWCCCHVAHQLIQWLGEDG